MLRSHARRRGPAVFALALAALLAAAGGDTTPPAEAAASGLVAAYAFDEGTGTTVSDASGNGNSGSIAGAAWTAQGRHGGALQFDGVNDWVTVPDAQELDLTGAMTLEAWVSPDTLSSWRTIVMKEKSDGLVYGLEANSDTNQPSGHVFIGSEVFARGGSRLPLGAWSHVAATYDGSILRVYVNGTQAASRSVGGTIATSGGALRIGGNAVWGEHFDGVLDDVRVYNRALTASEIQADMSTPVGGSPPPPPPPPPATDPVAAYSMDAGSGSTLADDSGSGNAGTIGGATWAAGRFGRALSFDGVDDWVTVGDAAELDLSSALTLEAWVRPDSLGFWKTVLMKEQPGNLTYGLFADSDTAQPTGNVYIGGQMIVRGASRLPLGAWTHLATTYDGSAMRIYVNGVQVGSRAQSGAVAVSDGVLRIGGNSVYPNEWFDGSIDELRIYARALTQSEIQTDMETAIGDGAPVDTTPPSAPANLSQSGSTATSVSLSWTASTDDVGVAGYDVYRDGTFAGTTAGTSFTVSGLACGTSYVLGVEAKDAAGNRSSRATLTASTASCPPSGAAVYLSPSGSDANPCTQAAPCRTLDRGYRAAQPGQVVELAGGTYPGGQIAADATKTVAADVVMRPATGATVTVSGELSLFGSHLTMRDMKLAGGWKTFPQTTDVTIANVSSRHFFIWSSSSISVVGGEVGPSDGSDYDSQLTTYSASQQPPKDILFDGVAFHDWWRPAGSDFHTECFQIGSGINVTIRNSRFWNCATHDIFIRSWGTINGSYHPLKNFVIENNFFARTQDGFYAIQFVDDLATDATSFTVRNNSSLQAFHDGIDKGTITFTGNVLSDMSSWECAQSSPGRWSYNVFESGVRCGSTDRVGPADYRDRAALDLHLLPGSAAIDAGNPSNHPPTDIDGQARPLGAAPDAGADEAQ